jgi:hypothetical protein
VSQTDPRGYYAALNISPTADRSEIKLAYHFLRASHRDGKTIRNVGKIEEAWKTLGKLESRAEYDGKAADRSGLLRDANGKSRLNSGALLAAISLAFLVVIAIIFGDQLKAPFVSYEVGDRIAWKATERPVGVVVAFEEAHPFPEGATQAAYRIRSKSGTELWFPAADLHLNGARE